MRTDIAINVVAFVTIVGFWVFFHRRWSRQAISNGPALLTTLGIFFCFLGIAVGLLDFDPEDVKGSVPQLLDGIRTAFWASVAGIFAAITIKVRHAMYGAPPLAPTQTTGANVSDLVEQLVRLNKSIAGDDDSTLINQVKLSRSDMNERLSKLQSSFENFVTLMAEANSKALIEALQKIVTDFNTTLKEQFGENFKQLNLAVEKLVVWQETYKLQLDDLITAETATRESMKASSDSFKAIVTSADHFSQTAKDLQQLLKALEEQKKTLNTQLTLLTDVVKDVSGKLPLLEPQILAMVTQVSTGVATAQKDLAAAFAKAAQAAIDNDAAYRKLMKENMDATQNAFNAHVKKMTEDTQQNIVLLDTALEKELTKSINTLGRQLTALSQQFVADYTPLTERLRQLVADLGRR
jgi:hypothetical protein